jgi:uncharacterized membrane protein YfcA
MTSFLVVTLGVPAPTAIGTDLVFATATKTVGSLQHYRQQSVNLEVALFLGWVVYRRASWGFEPSSGSSTRLMPSGSMPS